MLEMGRVGGWRGGGGGQTKNKNKCYSFGLSVLTDGQGVIYYPAQSVLYTCLYNIFLNVEAVHRLETCFLIFQVVAVA